MNFSQILCIHGYRQNADMFRQKLGAFRKALKKHVKFYFVTAPHVVLPFDPNLDGPTNGEAHTMGKTFLTKFILQL